MTPREHDRVWAVFVVAVFVAFHLGLLTAWWLLTHAPPRPLWWPGLD